MVEEESRSSYQDFLFQFPADGEDGVEDVLAVQYEDAEDEKALAGGEDDVQ